VAVFKNDLIFTLPVCKGSLSMRVWTRTDVDRLAQWPPYLFPYEPFTLPIAGTDASKEKDEYFTKRHADIHRISLVVDKNNSKVIGLFSLVDIDWEKGVVNNMAIRIRPDFCNQGIGSKVLLIINDWGFSNGLHKIRLDVAGSNQRAVRCYEKAGYKITGEFWRDDPYLLHQDFDSWKKHLFQLHHTYALIRRFPSSDFIGWRLVFLEFVCIL
jgi:RimJ/RimL family protein N-acetyltransferase